jgi:hypothetical protein
MNRIDSVAILASLACFLASACVITGDDDDDAVDTGGTDASESDPSADTTNPGTTDPGTTNPGTTDPGTTDPGTTDADTTDPDTTDASTTDANTTDPGTTDPSDSDPDTGETGSDRPPQDGQWQYSELGQGTNDCTFVDDPSNGFGIYLVSNGGAGMFTITPGDGTDPFECTQAGGGFDCAERLTGTYDIGMGIADATGSILVAIEGVIESPQSMSGEQQGRIECDGGDCGTAEQYLGVTFPCAFTIPFSGDAL